MNYPVIIPDEASHRRIVRSIARECVLEMVRVKELSLNKNLLRKADCYRISGSRKRVDEAVNNGELKLIVKQKGKYINRANFEEWLVKNNYTI